MRLMGAVYIGSQLPPLTNVDYHTKAPGKNTRAGGQAHLYTNALAKPSILLATGKVVLHYAAQGALMDQPAQRDTTNDSSISSN